jgi:hypothetical protein
MISTVVGTGVPGAAGDKGPAVAAQLDFPFGLAFDGSGNLLIADTLNQRIRLVDTQGKIFSIVALCGTNSAFRGDGGVSTLAKLNSPFGVAVDNLGNILVADTNNNRIRGGRGLVGLVASRGATCPSAGASPGPRGTAASSPGAGSPPVRLAELGGGSWSDLALQAPAAQVTGKPIRQSVRAPTRAAAPAAKGGTAKVKPPTVKVPSTAHATKEAQAPEIVPAAGSAATGSSLPLWLPASLIFLFVAIAALVLQRRLRLRWAREDRPPD